MVDDNGDENAACGEASADVWIWEVLTAEKLPNLVKMKRGDRLAGEAVNLYFPHPFPRDTPARC
jgi:hypothetical protein